MVSSTERLAFVASKKPDETDWSATSRIAHDVPRVLNSAVKKGYSAPRSSPGRSPSLSSTASRTSSPNANTFADELKRIARKKDACSLPSSRLLRSHRVHAEPKDDLSRLALRMDTGPGLPGVCAAAREAASQSCLWRSQRRPYRPGSCKSKANRGRKGFTDEERIGFQNLVDAGFVDTFRLFQAGQRALLWWSNFANRAFATWDGESITFSFQRT